ncbi:interphotoreceptor retinoid-binding protein [Virgisporangium aliadipatigenens]|uniref:Interphotoreceptor retinoid-binding protein n=1 Tax=Virgisporangium aliadipatigenens TaxID=741659 RepID=A0A8J4DTH4_9ACTN|nr:S41 family peptidase [Virgisporangium aliadipatigenens]GIJ48988.1 interphotoreceptor retinoid-binding protein [Virgisporangium aliadipatigenens]
MIGELIRLLDAHYVFPEVAAELGPVLRAGRYPDAERDAPGFAAAVTADLQSVNGDKHLRVLHHETPLPAGHGEEETDLDTMRRFADRHGGGLPRVEVREDNVGYLAVRPLLFPSVLVGDAVAAAFTLLKGTDALVLDLRECLGGEPGTVALVAGYLTGTEPVELSGIYERATDRIRQAWTSAYLPGPRYGAERPLYVLIGPKTFSGGEALAYDLQQMRRATLIGEPTRGGAHPRIGLRLADHFEATIPTGRSVHPVTGENWEGVGVRPDVRCLAGDAALMAFDMASEGMAVRGG